MYSGGPSSPACATATKPAARALAYTSTNSPGGWPASAESIPTPAMTSRWGSASSSISMASLAGRSRRKHMMRRQLRP